MSPCARVGRYAPNSHFQRLIDHAVADAPAHATETEGTIYAAPDEWHRRGREPYEDLTEFAERGDKLAVDGPLANAWRNFVRANDLSHRGGLSTRRYGRLLYALYVCLCVAWLVRDE